MSEESVVSIIVPIVSGSLAILGSFVGNYAISLKKSKEDAIKVAEREQAQKDQLEKIHEEQKEIKIRLDSHNGYAEKFAKNSEKLAVMEEKIDSSNKAIERLQKDIDFLKSDRCKV